MDRADAARAADAIAVEVVYRPEGAPADLSLLSLPAGATVADALQASGALVRHGLVLDGLQVGVWCRVCTPQTMLRDRDRVEIYRELRVDPKEARRQRYKGAAVSSRPGSASGTQRR
jgi:uncharacterized protein